MPVVPPLAPHRAEPKPSRAVADEAVAAEVLRERAGEVVQRHFVRGTGSGAALVRSKPANLHVVSSVSMRNVLRSAEYG